MSLRESFHPTVAAWFAERLGAPTPAQARAWPLVRAGRHVLVAAPTGSGKTLAAFLAGLDALLRQGKELPDETQLLYVSPLRALSNDVQKNLAAPLAALRARDPSLPEVRVLVRTGDTRQSARAAMAKRPPHVLVTTPESLHILLTSAAGRRMLGTVQTLIVDEIHAILGSKRGSHLALSLERLVALAGEVQRIGLSATQKPLLDVGRFLGGVGREVELVDEGHLRELDLAVELPPAPLETVCSHETFADIYARVAELVRAHKTTLVFVSTRKMAERVARALGELVGAERVTCHHSSLSKERRLDAEERLKSGSLAALVATASLELGIDIGDIDLVCQLGATRSIATLLQRVGRAGHGVHRLPKGRLFPLTRDELVEAAALLFAVRAGELDRTPQPLAPLDILAQAIVSECVNPPGAITSGEQTEAATPAWDEDALFQAMARAWPYRALTRADFDRVVALHTVNAGGRGGLLHRDGVNGRLRATRRARITAVTSGGAIPDSTQYQVVLEPEGLVIGAVDEDFAVESSGGDVFQLGTASWRVLRVVQGRVFVADAGGAPPSLPFWFGEAPARTRELSQAIGLVREHGEDRAWLAQECGLDPAVAEEVARYVEEGRAALGCVPTQERIVLERFFDESGGMQLVIHAPFGGRINRALGLALRKKFCRGFGFELQAAANEDAVVLSLGPQHAFPLEDVFAYLRPESVRDVLIQAVLPTPLFTARWRWNAQRSFVVERFAGGKRVPAPLLRMRADDALARAFPDAVACGENLPAGDLSVPLEHPLVFQTIEDCLTEALDVAGLEALLEDLRDGKLERVAVDLPEPSPFARSVLSARPYGFLDDAPLEERRTQAVLSRRTLDPQSADGIGELDARMVERVRAEAWPDPRNAEEVHEALLWMGYVTEPEAEPWRPWLEDLRRDARVVCDEGRWFALEAERDPLVLLRGRLEALGPIEATDALLPLLLQLEAQGAVLRTRFCGKEHWCDRRLLARIQRYTIEGLRRAIAPVSAAVHLRFLARWHGFDPEHRVEGPEGLRRALERLAGWEAPAKSWEQKLLPARVGAYRREWLDQLTLGGEVAWLRLFGDGNATLSRAPLALVPREDLETWLALAPVPEREALGWPARAVLESLERRGPSFLRAVGKDANLLGTDLERGLSELAARGLASCDSFASLRGLMQPASRRREPVLGAGRWSALARGQRGERSEEELARFVARALLWRYGVLYHALLERERIPLPWRVIARALRGMELAGDVRGGRFVERFAGEQFALPEVIALLRRTRDDEARTPLVVDPADPLNLLGVLTPEARVAVGSKAPVTVLPD